MEKTNLELALDWIYAHVVAERQKDLSHVLRPLENPGFVGYTQLIFTFEGRTMGCRAEELMATPEHAHWVIRDLHDHLDVPIIAAWYQFPGLPVEAVDPIGAYWTEKSKELGREVYYTGRQGIQTIYDGMPWMAKATDQHPAGSYSAKSGSSWFGLKTIWMWVKV